MSYLKKNLEKNLGKLWEVKENRFVRFKVRDFFLNQNLLIILLVTS